MARPALAWVLTVLMVSAVMIMVLCSGCDALRPGGEVGVVLTSSGSVVIEDGSILEEYELRQSNPVLAHFVSVGSAAHKLLQKSGYAYGALVRIAHSDRDKEYGERPERPEWFPMVVTLDVVEGGSDDGETDVTTRYEVALDFKPKTIAAPGLVILEARKVDPRGRMEASLEVLPPEATSFLEKNRQGITMMFGVIIASGIVKFFRRGMERLLRKAKQDREEREARDDAAQSSAAVVPTETKPSSRSAAGNPKKKGGTNAKQD